MRRPATVPALGTLLAAILAGPSLAQERSIVSFEPDDFGAMVSGTITGKEYRDYVLGASAGQEMFVELTVADGDGAGTAFFNVLPPGSDDVAIYNSAMLGNTTTVPLPESGDYTIRVYQLGDDADTGKTKGFNIDLSIQ